MAKKKKKIVKKTSQRKTVRASQSSKWPSWVSNTRLHNWTLFLFGVLLYANTFSHQYTQDDAIVIYDNMFTTQGFSGIPGILSYDTFYGFFKEEGKDKLVSGGRYRPLSLVTFAIEKQFFKKEKRNAKGETLKDANGNIIYEGIPAVGHIINALFYGLTVLVLYWLLTLIFQERFGKADAALIALGTSLLFAAHPIHTEAVANIKGRDEILTLLGSLGALYFSLRAFKEKKSLWTIVASVLFFLALLSKENAITFLAIVPLTYYFFTKADSNRIALQTLPFLGAAAVFLFIRGGILGWSLGAPSGELMNNPFVKLVGNQYMPFDLGEKMATIMFTLGKYIQLLLFPHPLTHDYYPRQVAIMQWGNWQVLLSLLIYLGAFIYAIRGLVKKDPISYGLLFYLITLSIVSNIIFPVGTNMSERFVFMPSIGICLILTILAYRLSKIKKGQYRNIAFAALGIVTLLFAAKTFTRNQTWKDNYTLFTTDIQSSPNSAKLRNAVGGELLTQSTKEQNPTTRQNMLVEASGHLQEAIRIHPTYKNAYLLLGNCYNYLKQYEQSIQYFQQALTLDPGYEDATTNLGITYREAGKYYGREKNDLNRSIQYLTQANALRPKDYETLRLLGVAHGISGQNNKAIEYFIQAKNLSPNTAKIWFDLGNAYNHAGDEINAQRHFQKAQELDPDILERYKDGLPQN